MENVEITTVKKPNTVLRVIVVGIIIILLIFLSIGIVRIVPKMLRSIANASLSMGSLFNTRKATTTDATSTPTTTGGTVATSTDGGFSIRDLTRLPTTGGNNYVPPAAPLPSSYGSANTPATTTLNNTPTPTTINSGTTGNTNTVNTKYIVGPSDIAVEIISKGIISKTTGAYIQTNTFTTNDMVVVKFRIENRGQFATGIWSARVDMPSSNTSNQVRFLNSNRSLPAGSAITGEARFNSPTVGTPSVSITVDTTNSTQDVNRGNNIISIPLIVSVYSSSNTGNTNPSYPIYTNPTPYYGAADLQIRILSTGIVNQFGQFTPNTYARFGEKAAVQFEVKNLGGTATGIWNWRADITGAVTNTYNSPTEASIAPGGSTTFIVGFDSQNILNNGYSAGYNSGYGTLCNSGPYDIYTGQYIGYNTSNNCYGNGYNSNYYNPIVNSGLMNFAIYIDTNNSIYETNESNNSASASLNLTY